MLKTILSISGKPGLYKLISQGKNMLIVESISAEKKRFPAYGNEKIISLADIAMYTNDAEVPLRDVLESIKEKENAAVASIDPKKATAEELRSYLAEVLPDFDRDRVYVNDIKKLILWYNILVTNGITEFKETEAKEDIESLSLTIKLFNVYVGFSIFVFPINNASISESVTIFFLSAKALNSVNLSSKTLSSMS